MPAVGVAAGVVELWPGPFDTTLQAKETEAERRVRGARERETEGD